MNDLRIILASPGPFPFLLIDQTDHRSPLPGQTPTVLISKDGNAFAPPLGTVTEVGFGSYELAGSATDAEVVGPVLLHATAPGADPTDTRYDVVSAPGAVPLATGATSYPPLPFLLVSQVDHVTGLTGVTPTVTIRKQGGTYAPPAGTVGEIGYGWYCLRPTTADIDTPGALLLHAEATGADPTDERYYVAGRVIPGPGVHADFLSALVAYWDTNSNLTEISPALYYGAAPAGVIWDTGDYYPYAVAIQAGSKSVGHTTIRGSTGAGYIEDIFYQISIYHSNLADAVNLGEVMIAALDPILYTPLTFANGYQMRFIRTGGTTLKLPQKGAGGAPNVFQQIYNYRTTIGRVRATT